MATSLVSSFNGAKPIQRAPCYHNLQRHSKINVVSCRATMLHTIQGKNLYKVLSLDSENVGVDEIKKAYRNMALQYHPDVCPPSRKEEFTPMFVELHKAYETLSYPISRRKYDYELGLRRFEKNHVVQPKLEFSRETWENELSKLRRRSNFRAWRTEGSWCNKVKAQRL